MSLLARVGRRLAAAFNAAFRRKNHVFRFEGPPAPVGVPVEVERYDRPESVPEDARAALGERAWTQDAWELKEGAVLWVGRCEGIVASAWMSRPGERFRAWFVPLAPKDIVLFRGRTFPEQRGRGVSPAVMREIVARELPPGAQAYVDVSIHNRPSIRAVEKAGFRRIATLKPVTRKEAYR